MALPKCSQCGGSTKEYDANPKGVVICKNDECGTLTAIPGAPNTVDADVVNLREGSSDVKEL